MNPAIRSQLLRATSTAPLGLRAVGSPAIRAYGQTRGVTTGKTGFQLNTGATIPAVGFGTFQDPGAQEDAVCLSLEAGLRLLDTARVYNVEKQVGKGIKNSGVPREDIFLGTKLWCNNFHPEDVERALDESLHDLDTPYVDLLMMHYPCTFARGAERFPRDADGKMISGETTYVDTWKAMEKLVETGKTKAIGVSNFSKGEIEMLLKECSVVSGGEPNETGWTSAYEVLARSPPSTKWKCIRTCSRRTSTRGSAPRVSTWSSSALWEI